MINEYVQNRELTRYGIDIKIDEDKRAAAEANELKRKKGVK